MPWMGYLQLSKSRSLHLIRSNSRPATRAHKVRILGTYRNPRSLTNRVAWRSTKAMALRLTQFLAIIGLCSYRGASKAFASGDKVTKRWWNPSNLSYPTYSRLMDCAQGCSYADRETPGHVLDR